MKKLRLEKNSSGQRHLEIDPEGGQGATWTVEGVYRDRESLV